MEITVLLSFLLGSLIVGTTPSFSGNIPLELLETTGEYGCNTDVNGNIYRDDIEWCRLPPGKHHQVYEDHTYYPSLSVCAVKRVDETCFSCFQNTWHQTDCTIASRKKREIFTTLLVGVLTSWLFSGGSSDSSDSSDSTTCPAGSASVDDSCVQCGRGSYQDETGQTSCKPCPDGYTTRSFGASRRSQCSVRVQE